MTVAGIWRSSPAHGRAATTSIARSHRARRSGAGAGPSSRAFFSMEVTSDLSIVTVAYLRRTTTEVAVSLRTTPSRVPPFSSLIVSARPVEAAASSNAAAARILMSSSFRTINQL
jgi:hypothetical protein